MAAVTQILSAIEKGDRKAARELLPLVYDELRRLAVHKMGHERPGQSLQATALVHEAYLRLVGAEDRARWDGSGHFFAAAAEAMRRILIENARKKGRLKRGGDRQRVPLDNLSADSSDDDLLALDESLQHLAAEDPVAARVVEMRYFAGAGHEQIAAALEITVYEARQKWTFARAWLRDAMTGN